MSANVGASELTPKQARAVAAILASRTIGDAAKAAGVNEKTITRWMAIPAFRSALLEAEGAAIDEATRRLLWLQSPAIETLAGVLDDLSNTPTVRLRAAQLVLDYLLKLRELRTVEERLVELEAVVYGKQN